MLFGITLRSPMTRKFRLRVGGIFTIVFRSYCTILIVSYSLHRQKKNSSNFKVFRYNSEFAVVLMNGT